MSLNFFEATGAEAAGGRTGVTGACFGLRRLVTTARREPMTTPATMTRALGTPSAKRAGAAGAGGEGADGGGHSKRCCAAVSVGPGAVCTGEVGTSALAAVVGGVGGAEEEGVEGLTSKAA